MRCSRSNTDQHCKGTCSRRSHSLCDDDSKAGETEQTKVAAQGLLLPQRSFELQSVPVQLGRGVFDLHGYFVVFHPTAAAAAATTTAAAAAFIDGGGMRKSKLRRGGGGVCQNPGDAIKYSDSVGCLVVDYAVILRYIVILRSETVPVRRLSTPLICSNGTTSAAIFLCPAMASPPPSSIPRSREKGFSE